MFTYFVTSTLKMAAAWYGSHLLRTHEQVGAFGTLPFDLLSWGGGNYFYPVSLSTLGWW